MTNDNKLMLKNILKELDTECQTFLQAANELTKVEEIHSESYNLPSKLIDKTSEKSND